MRYKLLTLHRTVPTANEIFDSATGEAGTEGLTGETF